VPEIAEKKQPPGSDDAARAPAEASASGNMRDSLVSAIPNLRAFAVSLTGNHHLANDLVQETLLKAWANREKFTIGTNFKAWLFTILRNTYFSDLRKARREVQDVDGRAAAQLVSPPEQHGQLDLADFRQAMTNLSEDQREALILIGAEGFSYEEAAVICDCAVGTVKSRVNRARSRLGELMSVGSVSDIGHSPTSSGVVDIT
jgi:RNA polymerase sigma-70 factor (ECF subfamily)